MKVYFLVILLLARFVNGFSQTRGYTINGGIEGLIDGTVVSLVHETQTGIDTVSQMLSKSGKFRFRGEIPLESELFYIRLDTSTSKESLPIFLVNSYIKINGSIQDWPTAIEVNGSKPAFEYFLLQKMLKKPQSKLEGIIREKYDLRTKIYSGGYDTTLLMDSIRILEDMATKTADDCSMIMKKFIVSHTNSLYTPQLIQKLEGVLKLYEVSKYYSLLSIKSKGSFFGRELRQSLQELRASEAIKIGATIPNFTLKSPNGQNISLKTILAKGNLTLLDFWASWCHPCREETPNLKRVYDTFHTKGFNILSISLDKDKSSWKEAIDKDKMSWDNGKFDGGKMNPCKIFNIVAIPAFVLIDNNGRILSLQIASSKNELQQGGLEGEELYHKIEGLLKNKTTIEKK